MTSAKPTCGKQKPDWRSIAPVTGDYVVNLELTHLVEDLRASVPAPLRKRLAREGLL